MRDLSRLLRPKSIAVIGGGWGIAVIEQCLKMGFQGEIWPVHPERTEVGGLACYRSLGDLPSAPDATFVAVNRHLTIDAVAQLSVMGAGGAVCFASGFAEAEDDRHAGTDLQKRLIEAAGDMPVLGPNCYGFINYLDGALLWPDQHGGVATDRGVAILTQSSNVLINLTMQRRGLPVSYCLAAGNQAQTDLAAMAMSVMEDDRVSALGLHIEGISDIRAFETMAARAGALGMPVVALKVGRSEQAQAATISHTASLAGGDAASRAFLRRLGVPQVASLPEFLETLKLLHVHGALPGRTLCSMSCSGGEASLIADAAVGRDVVFRPLTTPETSRVKATLSDLVTIANPLDYHTFIWGDAARMTDTYCAMLGNGFDLSCLVYDFPRTDRTDDAAWQCGEDAIIAAASRTGARTAVVTSLVENMPEHRAATLLANGIAPMMGFDETMAAVEASAAIRESWQRGVPAPVMRPSGLAEDSPQVLDEAAAKPLLARFGVQVPAARPAARSDDAAQAAEELGFPVALKGLGIAHKTEAGAVALGLHDCDAVRRAAGAMSAKGFLVERMITDAVAELIVGVVLDPVYGFTLTLGAGGTLTELLDDSVTLMMPSSETEIRGALASLRMAPLLNGYRGRPVANMDAVVAAVQAVQAFAEAHLETLVELDINPLIVTPDSAVAADALIRMRP